MIENVRRARKKQTIGWERDWVGTWGKERGDRGWGRSKVRREEGQDEDK